jgi:predicted MFS family arabinose efflux permease
MTGTRIGPAFLTILFTGYIAATYGFGVYLFPALMPDMIADFAIGYGGAGTIASLTQVGFLVSSLISGLVTEKIGAPRLVNLSMAVCVACLSLVPLAPNAFSLAVFLIVMGATSASVWVPMVAIAKLSIPTSHQGKALGLMSSGTAYGLFVNGFSIPLLLPSHGWQMVWTVSAGLSGVLLVVGLIALRGAAKTPGRRDPTFGDAGGAVPYRQMLIVPRNLLIPAMMFLSGIAAMPSQNYLVALVQDELGFGVNVGANIWKTIGFIGMFGGFAMGIIADYISVRRTLALSYAFLAIAVATFLHHGSLVEIYLGAALFGLAFNAIFGLIPAYVSLTYPARMTAPIFGFSNVMLGLGAMAGNMIGGLTKEATGSFQTSYALAAGTVALLFFVTLMLRGEKRSNAS